jgi:hypothetical protein
MPRRYGLWTAFLRRHADREEESMRAFLITGCAVAAVLAALAGGSAAAEEHVYMYPLALTETDRLTDGPHGEPMRLRNGTMLIWVDLFPNMRFVHPTLYVLLADEESRVVDGQWWPELNGKRILFGGPGNHTLVSPFSLTGQDASGALGEILVHMYPVTLSDGDVLADGPQGRRARIRHDTMLIWVDLHPDMRFAHPTLYVLIYGRMTRIIQGEWWPVLNGRQILYGSPANYTVMSPFVKQSPVSPAPVQSVE